MIVKGGSCGGLCKDLNSDMNFFELAECIL